MRILRSLVALMLGLSFAQPSRGEYSTHRGEWPQYGGDLANSRYSPLEQIDGSNVHRLRIAWSWDSVDNALLERLPTLRPDPFKATPSMIEGVLYVRTPLSVVAAIDGDTGRTLWTFDPKSYEDASSPKHLGWNTRGLAYWRSGDERALFVATRDARLVALDPSTGRPLPGFGDAGELNLRKGLRRPLRKPEMMSYTSPPVVCGDVVVVGSAVLDSENSFRGEKPPLDYPLGDVRGYDARTGRQLWTFHTVPQQGEYGVASWGNESWRWVGATNVWSVMAADEELGQVYLPVSAPTNNWWGGFRPGRNLFGQSLVALDAKTGRRIWHYQTVHHPLWDYDLAAPPMLVDIVVDGKPVRAVVQLTKTGFAFVLHRKTGTPVFPVEERPVPASTIPGEHAWPTQPFPTRPAAFEAQGVRRADLIDFTPELRAEAERFVSRYDHGGLFTPVSRRGTILVPGIGGGATWTAGAFDRSRGVLYVTSMPEPTILSLKQAPREWPWNASRQWPFRYVRVVHRPTLDSGLPFLKPPYARLTAIDLGRGEILWSVANGDGPRLHPRLRALDLPALGTSGNSSVLATATLLFAATTGEGTFEPDGSPGSARLRAFDKATGAVVWEHELEPSYPGGATPMTYLSGGRQHLVIAVGGGTLHPARLVAFRLDGRDDVDVSPSRRAPDVDEDVAITDGVRQGARSFRRQCSACHSIGEGVLQGPDLYGSWKASRPRLHAAVLAMQQTRSPQLPDAEVPLLVDFLLHPRAAQILHELEAPDAR